MSDPQAKHHATVPPRAQALIDEDFIAHRAKLLEVAAYLDRADRYGSDSPLLQALAQASQLLSDGQPNRTQRLLELFSDHSQSPLPQTPAYPVTGVAQGNRV